MISYLGYQIDPDNGTVIGIKGKRIGKKIRSGYIQIQRNTRHWMAHRLIWESVNGPIPKGLEINHINGIKDDNRLVNLELVTRSENGLHAFRIGLISAKGERNGRSIAKRRKQELGQ